jgi:hypothetical protein
MFAFPLRTSTRYPEGFDQQTVGSGKPSRQTYWSNLIRYLWTALRKSWAKPRDELWMNGARNCAEAEESDATSPSGWAFRPLQPVDKYW